ncbi:MAG: hypothetical protein LBK95_00040 [Bifidobacteriaceae bacterium]|jgi:hypothetical protein|nr:hypothetical protein [Bifidobacteriaceae bacterium]
MRRKFRATVISVALVCVAVLAVPTRPAQSTVEVDAAIVDTLEAYLTEADLLWCSQDLSPSTLAASAGVMTEAEELNSGLGQRMANVGEPITDAVSSFEVLSVRREGVVATVEVEIATKIVYGGSPNPRPSGFRSDKHEVTIRSDGANMVVTGDRRLEPPSSSAPGGPKVDLADRASTEKPGNALQSSDPSVPLDLRPPLDP